MDNPKLSASDLEPVPFAEGGGRGRAAQRFGEGIESVLHELNEVLAA